MATSYVDIAMVRTSDNLVTNKRYIVYINEMP